MVLSQLILVKMFPASSKRHSTNSFQLQSILMKRQLGSINVHQFKRKCYDVVFESQLIREQVHLEKHLEDDQSIDSTRLYQLYQTPRPMVILFILYFDYDNFF